jgi:myo-inositol-1(or 4)-monophosphatase
MSQLDVVNWSPTVALQRSQRPSQAEGWLATFERLGAEVRKATAPWLGTEEGGREVGSTGAGGDRTLEIDQRAEDLVLHELRGLANRGERFSVLSEEVGLVELGAEYPRVVLDPVDGSPNAQRGIRMVGVMMSLLEGPTVADVVLGTTIDMTSGERWSAIRGAGAFRDGRPLRPVRFATGDQIEVLGLHALPSDLPRAWPLLRSVSTFRQLYCMSLSLTYTAAGGIDVFCSPRRARIFDLTAGLLMVQEVGGVVTNLAGEPIDGLVVDLETRTTLLCSAHPDLHQLALEHAGELASGTKALLDR